MAPLSAPDINVQQQLLLTSMSDLIRFHGTMQKLQSIWKWFKPYYLWFNICNTNIFLLNVRLSIFAWNLVSSLNPLDSSCSFLQNCFCCGLTTNLLNHVASRRSKIITDIFKFSFLNLEMLVKFLLKPQCFGNLGFPGSTMSPSRLMLPVHKNCSAHIETVEKLSMAINPSFEMIDLLIKSDQWSPQNYINLG